MIENIYLRQVNKLELVITDACTGRCAHCSQGAHSPYGICMDAVRAAETVRAVTAHYPIQTLLTFGGEPLLFPETVFVIQSTGRDVGIPHRQVITNGYVTEDARRIAEITAGLAACGVNDLRLSVDAFHQAHIPLAVVKQFAASAKDAGLPVLLQPAWLVGRGHPNPYNQKTEQILASFAELGLGVHPGNVIFPSGNAARSLAAYFTNEAPQDPYVEDPCNVQTISIAANGDVLGGNFYRQEITEILQTYRP